MSCALFWQINVCHFHCIVIVDTQLLSPRYIGHVDGLKHMLARYHTVLASLDEAELNLLREHITELRRVVRPGAKRLNWNSLGKWSCTFLENISPN